MGEQEPATNSREHTNRAADEDGLAIGVVFRLLFMPLRTHLAHQCGHVITAHMNAVTFLPQ